MNDERFAYLLDQHFNGELTDAECAELSAHLLHSAADRARFWDRAETHVLLHEALQRQTAQPEARPARAWWQPAAWWAAAACVAALCFAWSWWRSHPAAPVALAEPEVAVVMQMAEARWPAGAELRPGDRLRPGLLRLEAGLVRLRFFSGASVVLQGPLELDLKAPNEAVVLRGKVTASVPPVAEGFTLATVGWRMIDRGTVFGVNVPTSGNAELHVLKGKVDLRANAAAAQARSLTTGQAASLGNDGTLVDVPSQPETFPSENDVFARAATQQSDRLVGWRESSRRAAQEASLLLYYDFENADHEIGIIRNLAPAATKASDGVLIGGEWAEGRWPGKNAVAFRRVGDLIRTLPARQLPAATFVVWVRFDASFEQRQTLLLSPKVGPGQVYWLVWPEPRRGPAAALAFVKTDQAGRDRYALAHGVLTAGGVGRWLQLAVVADAARGKVSHYLNGVRVSEQDFGDSLAMDLNELVIGNWGYTREPSSFVGRMDELAIYRRALAAEEIVRLYADGKP